MAFRRNIHLRFAMTDLPGRFERLCKRDEAGISDVVPAEAENLKL